MSDEYTLPVNDDIYITGETEEVVPDFSEIDDDDSTQETVTRTPANISSDNRSSIGSGELNPSPSDAVPADVSTSDVIVTQRVRHQIDDYEPAALKALSDAGAVFYGVYADGHEEGPVSWTEVHDLDPEGTIIELDEEIASAIAQNFWADTQGVHITDDPYDEWIEAYESNPQFPNLSTTKNYYNILLNAGGALLRRALNNLVSINRTAISFYDGLGNASTNIMAFFGRNGAQIGRSDEKHVVINSSGIGSYNGDGTVADFTMRGSSIVNSTISGSALVDNTITGGKIANATITGAKIDSGTITNANIANGTITGAKIDSGTITNANIADGTIQGSKIQGSTLTDIPFAAITDAEVEVASIADAQIATATITEAQVENLTTDYAHLQNGVIDNATINHADVNGLSTTYATISNLNAATARIGDLEADHVSVDDFEAEQANIDSLQAATADIATIRADSAKVHSLTAAQLSAATAYIAALNADNITAASLSADVGKIHNLTANEISAAAAYIAALNADSVTAQNIIAMNGDFATVKTNAAKVANLTAAQLEADHATVGSLDANYAQINMANVNNAWIANGTIKDGAISNGMINSVSANKLTAGTIDASNITVTNLNADNITTGTINGQRIGEGSLSLSKLEDDVYTETEVDSIVSNLQTQIDGAIETWTGTAVPTLSNSPASSWTTNAIKDTHVGDVYFVVNSQSQQNGYNYRFTKSGNTYSWQLIKDSDVTNALQRLTTAEGKIGTIEQFDSDISSWKTDTDEEISSIKSAATTLAGRVSTAEGQIATKVEQSTFNTLSQTVDENSASITQLTTETTSISSKVDSQNPFIIGTQTSQTGNWTGNAPTLTSLVDGQQITYWLPYAPSGNASLNLTLKDGSETGAIPCYYSGTSRLTTHYSANNAIHLTYRTNISGITQGWWADANYDSNSPYSKYSDTVISGKNGLKRYTLCMRDDAGNITSIVNQANNTNSSGKTCYTGGLQLGNVYYHQTGGDYAAGANSGVIWESYGGIDFRYSVNGIANAASTELQLRKPVYLVGTIGADGLFYLDTTKWWTQTSFVEGKAYVLVGTAYSSYYGIFVAVDNPTYIYEDDELVEIQTSRITKTTNKVNTVSDTVDEHTRKIGNLETTVETKADGSTVDTISSNLNTISDTVSGHTQTISSITSTQTTMQGKLDKTLVETTQLWFSKANTTAPNKPTTQVTSTATTGNAWTTVVPAYNASYPNYYYCYQWKYSDGTYGWSSVTRDIATGETQATARQAQADIDGLEIGGRNLLRAAPASATNRNRRFGSSIAPVTYTFSGWDCYAYYHLAVSDFEDEQTGVYNNIDWNDHVGEQLTYRAWMSIDSQTDGYQTGIMLHVRYADQTYQQFGIYKDPSEDPGWLELTITIPDPTKRTNPTTITVIQASIRHSSSTATSTVTVKEAKVEFGNKATDWTPAPEDVDADILTAQTSADNAQSTADKNVKSSIQLWFTKANGSSPAKPTAKVTSTSTSGNAWTTVVPTYSSGYPHYFYCWQYELADGTCTWSDVIYDRATTENQSNSRSAVSGVSTLTTKTNNIQDTVDGHTSQLSSITSTQTTIQGSAVKSTVQLWFTKSDTTAPAKPTAHVTTNNAATGNAWNLAVPTYNSAYPNYYYCYEYEFLNGTYGWSAVTRDIATGEMQATARQAQNDIDNLEIGGRNLLRNTNWNSETIKKFKTATSSTNVLGNAIGEWHRETQATLGFDASGLMTITVPNTTTRFGIYQDVSLSPGHYILSVDTGSFFKSLIDSAQWPAKNPIDGSNSRNSVEVDVAEEAIYRVYIAHNNGSVMYGNHMKLEKGNRATDWTPAPEDVDSDISAAQTSADNAQATANKNVKESQQLWFTKANGSAPSKPSAKVTSTSTGGNAWTTKVPTYNENYPHYFYCMQYIAADGTVTWSDVVYDQATTEAQSVARTTSANLSTLQSDYATFKQTTQSFESTIGTTYATKTELQTTDNKIDNLEIGGRNLVMGTSGDWSEWYTPTPNGTNQSSAPNHVAYFPLDSKEGDFFTASLEVEFSGVTAGSGNFAWRIQGSTDGSWANKWNPWRNIQVLSPPSDGVYRFSVTNEATSAVEDEVSFICGARADYWGSGKWRWRKVKVERGTKPTDWTPAPEDVDAAIDKVGSRTSVRLHLRRDNWSDANWGAYASVGHSDNFVNIHVASGGGTSATGFDGTTLNAGDLIVIEGISTGTSIPYSATAKVTSVPTSATGDIPATVISANNAKAIESRVSNTETSIQQTNNQIALKANASDVYTKTQTDGLISTEVTNRNSAIQQSANAINLSVSQMYTTKEAFEALEVGGRNLFAMAGSVAGYLHTNGIDISGQSSTKERTTDYISVDASTKYSLQAWYDESNPSSSYMWVCLSWYASDKTHIVQAIREHMTADNYKSWVVDSPANAAYARLSARWVESGWVYGKVKFERGNKPTDWSPAPEDMVTTTAFESAKSEIKQTTDGITSTVSKISSAKYYTGGSSTLANIKVWAAEGYTSAWNFTGDLSNLRIGDTVYLKYGDTTRGCNVYIKGTVNSISGQSVNFTSHGYEDVLPVDTIKSTINQSADSVKIEARHVNIEGAAIFSSGRLSTTSLNSTYDAKGAAQDSYAKIQSRGEQLITNGNGFMGDNTNFSGLTFDGSKANGSPGSFTKSVSSVTITTDELFPVDPSKQYKAEFDVMAEEPGAAMYAMLLFYDVDKKLMSVQHVSYFDGSTTTLAQDLKNGDTKVYLTSAAGFHNTTASHERSLIFWNYTNSFGYTYPPETYSRNFYAGLWASDSSVDKTNNTITLSTAWSKGTIPAGTPVSQNMSGSNYSYFWYVTNKATFPREWTHISGEYNGVRTSGTANGTGKFWPGTAYCKIGWLWNHTNGGTGQGCIWVTNISVKEDVATSAELNVAKANAVTRTQRIYYRKSASGAPGTPGSTSSAWVSQTGNVSNAWTTMHVPISSTEKFIYTCEQRQFGDGNIAYTSVLLDNTITVIDGGNIITGSIAANKLDVYDATIGKISTSAINLTGYAQTNDIPTKVSDLTNDTGFVTNDDIQIGGRNLLRNSKAEHSQSSSTATWFEWPITEAPLNTSQDYTFSFDAKTSNGTDVFYVGFANGSAATQETMATGIKPTTTYTRMSVTARTTKTNIRSILVSSTTSYGRGNGSNTGGTLYIKNVKLERGNKATDWSPAPEDVDANISSKADPEDIPTKVSDLTNDSGFQNSSQVETAITSKGYQTSSQVETAITSKGYATQANLTTESNQRKAQYGTCSTAAATQAKAVTCSNFELVAGKELTVKFSTANTYASGAVQLNVNSKGAKNIWVANSVTSSSNQLLWGANAYITFRYDGTQFIVIGEPRTWYGASTTAEGTAAKTDTTAVTGCVICKGAKVELAMTNANTATAPTLNIQSTGAKNVYFGNGTARPTKTDGTSWLATNTCTFTFDGQYWRTAGKTYIDANSIVTGYLSADRIEAGSLSANKISATSGQFNTANIPNLDAAKITSGTIDAARINASALTINSQTLGVSIGRLNNIVTAGDDEDDVVFTEDALSAMGRNIHVSAGNIDISTDESTGNITSLTETLGTLATTDQVDDLDNSVTNLADNVSNVQDYVNPLTSWINITEVPTSGGGTEPALQMGTTEGNAPVMQLTNSMLQFRMLGDANPLLKMGVVDGESLLEIMKAVVLKELRFNNFAFIARPNGNVCLKYIGRD